MAWHAFSDGTSVGAKGSEGGTRRMAEAEAMELALHAIVSQFGAAGIREQARLARDFVDRFPT